MTSRNERKFFPHFTPNLLKEMSWLLCPTSARNQNQRAVRSWSWFLRKTDLSQQGAVTEALRGVRYMERKREVS